MALACRAVPAQGASLRGNNGANDRNRSLRFLDTPQVYYVEIPKGNNLTHTLNSPQNPPEIWSQDSFQINSGTWRAIWARSYADARSAGLEMEAITRYEQEHDCTVLKKGPAVDAYAQDQRKTVVWSGGQAYTHDSEKSPDDVDGADAVFVRADPRLIWDWNNIHKHHHVGDVPPSIRWRWNHPGETKKVNVTGDRIDLHRCLPTSYAQVVG